VIRDSNVNGPQASAVLGAPHEEVSMISKIIGFEIPTRYANFCICGVTFVLLMVANLLPASAAVIGAQPGALSE
jgi:hypothetical protein